MSITNRFIYNPGFKNHLVKRYRGATYVLGGGGSSIYMHSVNKLEKKLSNLSSLNFFLYRETKNPSDVVWRITISIMYLFFYIFISAELIVELHHFSQTLEITILVGLV